MQLKLNDYLCSNGYEHLNTGYCGPIYVNKIWSEDVTAGSYVDKYWETGCSAFAPKRMIKAEIECESLEILNSILGKIANIVACPFDDPLKSITDKANEELASVINAKVAKKLISENIDSTVDALRLERNNNKKYKLKYKLLKIN